MLRRCISIEQGDHVKTRLTVAAGDLDAREYGERSPACRSTARTNSSGVIVDPA